MEWIDRLRRIKLTLVLAAIVIAVGSLFVSKQLTDTLKLEERNRMEVWAEAMKSLNKADANTDLSLVLKVINENDYIPVVLMDQDGKVTDFRNVSLHADNLKDSLREARQIGLRCMAGGHVIRIELDKANYINVCYDESLILKRLTLFPVIQLGVVLVFVLLGCWRSLHCWLRSARSRIACGRDCRRRRPISLERLSAALWGGWRCCAKNIHRMI